MMKDRSYLVFVIASILACIPLTFYYSFTNAYLNDVGVVNAAGKMTLGQVSEVVMMLAMPIVFRLLSVRGILLLGLLAWALRYVLLALRQPRRRHVDVLRRDPAARRLLRLLLRDRPALHRSGGAGAPAQHRAGLHHLRDLRRRHADRVAAVGRRARLLHDDDRRASVRNWTGFWLSSALMSFAIMLLVLFFFRSRRRIAGGQRRPRQGPQTAPDTVVSGA